MNTDTLGIYIHIPFCKSKCYYCNFNSVECINKNKENEIEKYYKAIVKEIIYKAEFLTSYKIDTIYIGGGTPSYIDSKYIIDILKLIKSICNIENAEITIEVNPGTITEEKIKDYISAGINRISVGMQSTNNDTLKKIGRIHTYEDFLECIKLIKKYNIENFSVDYIYGLPGQNVDNVKEEIKKIISLNPKHISTYDLEVHENGKLEFLIDSGYITIPSDDEVIDIRHAAQNILENNNYIKYEISNFAISSYESKHNIRYWNQEKYLGLGASASSFYGGMRFTNESNILDYIDKINNNEIVSILEEDMDLLGLMKEYIILRLRLKEGINTRDFKKKFKEDIYKYFKTEIKDLIDKKLLDKKEDNIFLTEKGLDLANIVWEKFI